VIRIKTGIVGNDVIDKVLKGLPAQVNKKILMAAFRIAAKPLIEDAKSRVPVDKGDLRDSIGAEQARAKGKQDAALWIGPRRTKKRAGWRAHFVEYGTSGIVKKGKGKRKKGSRFRPDQPARPFMRPAIDAKLPEVEANIKIEIGKSLRRYMLRTIRKGRKK
jgi:HK97 gp10 family phage protein